MDFRTLSFKPNITPVDVIKNQRFNQDLKSCIWWKHILETFIRIDK